MTGYEKLLAKNRKKDRSESMSQRTDQQRLSEVAKPATRKWLVLRVDRDSEDTHAVPYEGDVDRAVADACAAAVPDEGATLEYAIVAAPDGGDARLGGGNRHGDAAKLVRGAKFKMYGKYKGDDYDESRSRAESLPLVPAWRNEMFRLAGMPSGQDRVDEAAKLKWEKKDEKIFAAFGKVQSETTYGKPRSFEVAFRIDGRGGKYRVDKKTLSMEPWEAIDGGTGFDTLAPAQAYAAKWLEAANAQKTLSPRVECRADRGMHDVRVLSGIDPEFALPRNQKPPAWLAEALTGKRPKRPLPEALNEDQDQFVKWAVAGLRGDQPRNPFE